ncbi:MAG: hypothetical protein WCL02_07045 [bacterium]
MNFKNNTVSSSAPHFFTSDGSGYKSQHPKKSTSFLTLFVVVICTFALAFLIFKNFDNVSNLFSSSSQISTGFQIGQTVSLSGILASDGDLISYTHTLTLSDARILGLKSKTVDLSMYTGKVDIQ